MEYGQQMNQAKDNAMMAFYQNPGYHLERRDLKTFILKWVADTPRKTEINETLQEPLIIDRLSDIYLESFLTWHANTRGDATANNPRGLNLNHNPATAENNEPSSLSDRSAFVLKINEFNNQGNSSEGNTFNKIIIPHVIEAGETNYRKIHKSRKLNYICSMNPTTLSSLTGTITALDGTTGLFDTNDMFLAEFVIVARD